MGFRYVEDTHQYFLDEIELPTLTGMLSADGCSDHLDNVPPDVLKAKTEWGSRLHLALQKAEYGFGIYPEFKQHCVDWLDFCRKMKWTGKDGHPIWTVCEIPRLARVGGFVWGYTPDRVSPQVVVEIKGTYAPHYGHGIQTALQVIGEGLPRETKRVVVYFDKEGLKKMATCTDSIKRDGQTLSVWDEADRIIFEHALAMEAA
jgi:hypothetical protein